MNSNKKMHFEISERKVLLKIFDVIWVLLMLYIISSIFDFNYFTLSTSNYYWAIVLAIYINVFGSVFEMYNLQVASNEYQVIKSIILTSSTTVLVYLLTPIYTPFLPSNRIQIIYFFISILVSLLSWRIFYVKFLASTRFEKKGIIVCDKEQLQELINGIENVDPHYKFIAYVNSDGDDSFNIKLNDIINIKTADLESFVSLIPFQKLL
jgi:FlaA1/EpsC-like NDP-sugar epimerase